MSAEVVIFITLVMNQLLATGAFLGLYVTRSRWQSTPVGRHVLFWSGAAGVLDVTWLLILVWQKPWLIVPLFIAQGLVGVVTWQRVWLVWRAQHPAGD